MSIVNSNKDVMIYSEFHKYNLKFYPMRVREKKLKEVNYKKYWGTQIIIYNIYDIYKILNENSKILIK